MSLLEEARAVRERIAARLRELEPLVKEYNELQQAAAEMGIEAGEGSSVPATQPDEVDARPQPVRGRQGARAPATAEASGPPAEVSATGGDVGAQVLDAVRAQPGMTVAEYARLLDVPPASLYRPVRELTNEGAIVKRGRRLFPG